MNKEPLSVEELMKPRYKVIAGWPDNTGSFDVGAILLDWHNKLRFSVEKYTDYLPLAVLQQHSHLFRKLKWQEERLLEDLPLYVKDKRGVYKVDEWHTSLAAQATVFIDPKVHEGYIPQATCCPLYSDFLPATEEQYLNFINRKL